MRGEEAPHLDVEPPHPQRLPLRQPAVAGPEPLRERVVDRVDELDRLRIVQHRIRPPRLDRPVIQRPQQRLGHASQLDRHTLKVARHPVLPSAAAWQRLASAADGLRARHLHQLPARRRDARLDQEAFCPLLEVRVRQELARQPVIYVDDSLETGVSWPEQLGIELGKSRILIALWAKDYFASPWCTAEAAQMLAQAEATGRATAVKPRGLVATASFSTSVGSRSREGYGKSRAWGARSSGSWTRSCPGSTPYRPSDRTSRLSIRPTWRCLRQRNFRFPRSYAEEGRLRRQEPNLARYSGAHSRRA
jgi:hypothetical protein